MALRNTRQSGNPSLPERAFDVYDRTGIGGVVRKTVSYILFKNRYVGRIHHQGDKLLYNYRHYRHPCKFSDASPYKIIHVDPERIEYKLRLDDPDRDVGYFYWWDERNRVYDGPWDRQRADFLEFHNTLYDCFESHFLNSVPWAETTFIQQQFELVDRGETTWHSCSSRQDVRDRCGRLDRVWNDITTNGYRRQAVVNDVPDWRKDFAEVMINVGRDGELLQNSDGKHRLMMAKLAGIDEIPAYVIVRHKQWQQLRNAIRNDGVDDYPTHPDLEDLTGGDEP